MRRIVYIFSIIGFFSVALLCVTIAGGLAYAVGKIGVPSAIASFSLNWSPSEGLYGVLPMVVGSFSVAILATLIAIPLAFGIIVYIWAYNGAIMRLLLRFMMGIPTVVYSFCGLFILVPLCRALFTGSGYNILSVSIVLAFLILPTMATVADSALYPILSKAEPLQITAAALGLSKETTLLRVALCVQGKWLITGVLLSFSRALGDTMVALMISGNTPILPSDGIFSSFRALSAHISLLTASEITPRIEFTMFLAAALLFTSALSVSLIAKRLRGA